MRWVMFWRKPKRRTKLCSFIAQNIARVTGLSLRFHSPVISGLRSTPACSRRWFSCTEMNSPCPFLPRRNANPIRRRRSAVIFTGSQRAAHLPVKLEFAGIWRSTRLTIMRTPRCFRTFMRARKRVGRRPSQPAMLSMVKRRARATASGPIQAGASTAIPKLR